MKVRRFLKSQNIALLCILIVFFISLISTPSAALNNFTASRNFFGSIVSNENAFIGLDYKDIYYLPEEECSFSITNNISNKVEYSLELSGDVVNPVMENFTLLSGEQKQIKVTAKDEVPPGEYLVSGVLKSEWTNGSCDVNISFKLNIQ